MNRFVELKDGIGAYARPVSVNVAHVISYRESDTGDDGVTRIDIAGGRQITYHGTADSVAALIAAAQ